MKAQVINQFGDPNVFCLTNISKPTLKPGHVLIAVKATSVNQIDCKIRSGVVPAISPEFPAVLHGDVAGVIVEAAKDVTQFKVGDEVYGCAGGVRGSFGALAELMLADAKLIAKKPKRLSMTHAAALPLVSITVWDALFNKAKLTKDHTILIHGGVGGVGHIAVQLAKWCGANIFTTVIKNDDFELAKSLGACQVINAKDEEVDHYVQRLTQGKGFDIILDTIGGAHLEKSFAAAAINGSVVTTAARATQDLTPMHNKALSLHAVFMLLPLLKNQHREEHGQILAKLADIVDQGQVTPLVDPKEFTFATISAAHTHLESGQAQGKVVLSYP